MMTLSLIVPVWNEEGNIRSLIERIDTTLRAHRIRYEIILIDDHSSDSTVSCIRSLEKKYPISLFQKQGKRGKAQSLLEGFKKATYETIAMIDADLQYPPEALPQMIEKLQEGYDIVVANRKHHGSSILRRVASHIFRFIFGTFLHRFSVDVQSGLKIFRKEIVERIPFHSSGWSFDLEFLVAARHAGYSIGSIEIEFHKRFTGKPKIHLATASISMAIDAIRLKLRSPVCIPFHPVVAKKRGKGFHFKGKEFVHYTDLATEESAFYRFGGRQKVFFLALILFLVASVSLYWHSAIVLFVACLTILYFSDLLFNFLLIYRSFSQTPEIQVSPEEIHTFGKKFAWPSYTIMCPLYREWNVVPQFISAMSQLDYPKEKMQILLLLEEDDTETIQHVKNFHLPSYVRTLVIPHSFPKTKPKALNFGLAHANGEYVVVYDAEDIPEPDQLKKAVVAFHKEDTRTVCIQAKLNFYNPQHNLLTRIFTAEYSLWFDLVLTGLQSLQGPIPLGGTSNHFKAEKLQLLSGWDAFNVTEDCDLGTRLFKKGYKTAIVDSTTLEEANSSVNNWFRQRSRWIKGYIQTYFVHMRHPITFVRHHGLYACMFQLIVGGKVASMFINPFLWIATVSYFLLYQYVGAAIESVYPTVIFYLAATSLVFGNFLCMYYYMVGCAKRDQWWLVKYVFLVPLYWLMGSISAAIALFQFIARPHYWEKTHHGLHLSPRSLKKIKPQRFIRITLTYQSPFASRFGFLWKKMSRSTIASGGVLILASLFGNFFNFLYTAYVVRVVSVEDFGTIGLVSSFLYITQLPFGALAATMTFRSAYLLGKYEQYAHEFWAYVRSRSFIIALVIANIWILATPFLIPFFQATSALPFLLFTPVWVIGTLMAIDQGFLTGTLRFGTLAFLVVFEAGIKFFLTALLVHIGYGSLVYVSIPVAMMCSIIFSWWAIRCSSEKKTILPFIIATYFPRRFFAISLLTKISTISFLSLDVILAKHYLSPVLAGEYARLAVIGKIVFFVGTLFGQFITPLVSRNEGAGRNSQKIFYMLLSATAFASVSGVVGVGIFGNITVPFLFGSHIESIVPYLPLYTIAMLFFTISMSIVSYHQARKEYLFAIVSFFIALTQIVTMSIFHADVFTLVRVMYIVGSFYLLTSLLLHISYATVSVFLHNLSDFIGLFRTIPSERRPINGKFRILIFNWRDTRHVWAGGAEAYIHELAKQWVVKGHAVTVFCGNDGKHPRNQVIDGVQMIRRGGFYTVYIWAFLYYILRLRGLFDVVIDSVNGVPFFTPLYTLEPVFLLIHHVHQDVFRHHLRFPLSHIAMFVESICMPFVYRNKKIITVSDSSKKEIIKLGFGKEEQISIVHPGVTEEAFFQEAKTKHPTFLYLGRLKPYKNIDIVIKAFSHVLTKHTQTKLIIAGEGESRQGLEQLADKLSVSSHIEFLGKVSEKDKRTLLATSWALLHASSVEGWGMTVIEANAAQTPVIAARVNGLKDSVVHEKTGILVPAKHIEEFTHAMIALIDDSVLRKKLSKNARDWAKEFSWELSAQTFAHLMLRELQQTILPPALTKAGSI